jgi:hypothetical protein
MDKALKKKENTFLRFSYFKKNKKKNHKFKKFINWVPFDESRRAANVTRTLKTISLYIIFDHSNF